MAERLVVTEAPARWVHDRTGETCTSSGHSEEVIGYGRCYDHQERIKRVIDPGTLLDSVQAAQDAASGDSNDKEIDLLREALDEALRLLGLTLPDARPRCAECDESIDESDPRAGYGMCASCLHDALRSGWNPGD